MKLGSSSGAKALRWLTAAAAIAFSGLLIYGGYEVALNNMAQASPALRIPLGYVYAALPVGGSLILIGTLGNLRYPSSRVFASATSGDVQEDLL